MTESRPEITFRASGAYLVLRLERNSCFTGPYFEDIPLSREEGFALQCKLCAAMEQVEPKASGLEAIIENMPKVAAMMMEGLKASRTEEPKPETWRDRKPML